jgi:hypothetical protein
MIKITSINYGDLYEDTSPLIDSSDLEPSINEGYSNLPNQFRFWLNLLDKDRVLIKDYHVIGYEWEPISRVIDPKPKVKRVELKDMIEAIGNLIDLPAYEFLEYTYTGDIGLHSDNGSEFCT